MEHQIVYYGHPICPYAHGVLLTLIEKHMKFENVIVPREIEVEQANKTGSVSDLRFFKDSGRSPDELKALREEYTTKINPSKKMPAILVKGTYIIESEIISEFIDKYSQSTENNLTPSNPFDLANTRFAFKNIYPALIENLYGLLRNFDPSKDADYATKIYLTLEKFTSLIKGPLFIGESVSLIDLNIFPFLIRFNPVLKHYRNFEMIPSNQLKYPWAVILTNYLDQIMKLESVKLTTLSEDVYVPEYIGFAKEVRKIDYDL